ncbi:hypothetical protein [Chitinimonas arctica]|uniref:hypothetical protein n=1 Tax=Chitinimonas arctica TaxID=2594795 RepID=UPI0015D2F5F6|nr:hypothetical protein [Chitinimonas arctica]
MEFQLLDRPSVQRIVGLHASNQLPGHAAMRTFTERLGEVPIFRYDADLAANPS